MDNVKNFNWPELKLLSESSLVDFAWPEHTVLSDIDYTNFVEKYGDNIDFELFIMDGKIAPSRHLFTT
jgi:hypothetical protein